MFLFPNLWFLDFDFLPKSSVSAEVTFSEKLTWIGDEAFAGGAALLEIEIPDTVAHIGKGCFKDCSSLQGTGVFFF